MARLHVLDAPVLEHLESRQMLSGTVLASVSGGKLVLTGDAQANDITLDQAGLQSSEVRITGDGTKIKLGRQGALVDSIVVSGITKGVVAKLGNGDDSITFTGATLAGSVTVSSGAGSSNVHLTQTHIVGALKISSGAGTSHNIDLADVQIGGKLTISNGSGTGHVTLTHTSAAGHVSLRGGAGTNHDMDLTDAQVGGKLTISNGSGTGHVTLTDTSAAGNVSIVNRGNASSVLLDGVEALAGMKISAKIGQNTVIVGDTSITAALTISTGSAADVVAIDDTTVGGKMTIATGSGDDLVNIEAGEDRPGTSTFTGKTSISLGGGNDALTIGTGTTGGVAAFSSTVKFHGGAGSDTLHSAVAINIFVLSPVTVYFESIEDPTSGFFVRSTGRDDPAAGSVSDPFKTIGYALAQAKVKQPGNLYVWPGTYAENTTAGYLYLEANYGGLTVTKWPGQVEDVVVTGQSGSYAVMMNGASNLTLKGLTVSAQNGAIVAAVALYGNTNNINLSECAILHSPTAGGSGLSFQTAAGRTLHHITITDTTVNLTANNAAGMSTGVIATGIGGLEHLLIDGLDVTATNSAGGGVYGFWMGAVVGATWTNDLVIRNVTASSSNNIAFLIGFDGQGPSGTITATLEDITATSPNSHAFAFGLSSANCVATRVHATGPLAILFKECQNNQVIDSVAITTEQGIYFKAAVGCAAIRPTIIATGGYCIQLNQGGTGNKSGTCTVTDATVIAEGDASIFLWSGAIGDTGGGICDRNTYELNGTGDFGDVYGVHCDTLEDVLVQWASAYDVTTNDLASTLA